jgi:hypothetical protein
MSNPSYKLFQYFCHLKGSYWGYEEKIRLMQSLGVLYAPNETSKLKPNFRLLITQFRDVQTCFNIDYEEPYLLRYTSNTV